MLTDPETLPETSLPPHFALTFRCPKCDKQIQATTPEQIHSLISGWPKCCDGVMVSHVDPSPGTS